MTGAIREMGVIHLLGDDAWHNGTTAISSALKSFHVSSYNMYPAPRTASGKFHSTSSLAASTVLSCFHFLATVRIE